MSKKFHQLIDQASQIVFDKENEIRLAITCFLAGGHLLIEDVPGVGKTTLVQVLGKLIGLQTHRIQFTVDLLPADILGGQIYHPQEQKFQFHQGPLFSQLIMADELNRASPRTQSALLQAMEEGQVSMDGDNWELPKPFHVIATQNPHQQLGTFPLPESQLDRFLMSLELHYASKETEIKLFQKDNTRQKFAELTPILSDSELLEAQKIVADIKLSEAVAIYISELLGRTRQVGQTSLPLSTRGGLALVRAAKAWAFLADRNHVRAEDVQAILIPVLGHRLGGNHGLRKGREWARTLQKDTPVPV